jgi:uncharacterized protein
MPVISPASVNPLPDACENRMTDMNLGGYVGKLLASNEQSWLQHVMTDNPNLFAAFADPEGNTLFKCMWHGEFPGKILTGMAQTYRAFRNPATLEAGNKMVSMFKSVQGTDGYLGPWSKASRFNGDTAKWDTWSQYHCIYGLYQWYKITGNRDALAIAIKSADCMYNYFIAGKQTFVSQNWAECNFAISHAFAILYQETHDKKYLDASEYIVLNEWKLTYDDFYTKRPLACDWLTAAMDGKAFYQSNQRRWESLHTLMTLSTLYQITGKQEYYNALEHFWQSIIQFDRHNFGGFGTGEGATGDLYGFGSETCSTVAWMAYSVEYLKLSKKSAVADELEISFFNAALGSLLGSHDFAYMNFSDGNRVSSLVDLAGHGFEGGRQLNCCQANGNRGISEITEWAVLTDNENLYINYYGSSNAETKTPGGNKIKILQSTDYPLDGKVSITLALDKKEAFKFNLRIPGWSVNTRVKVNGKSLENITPGNYLVISREWNSGDIIEINFDMSVHFWIGEDKCKGRTSVYYGPVLLAMDTISSVASGYNLEASAVKQIVFKENPRFWFYGLVNTVDGRQTALVDFASAGDRGEAYTTWLTVSGNDFALLPQKDSWLRHPVLGDPSFDNFERYEKNPIERGTPPFNWPVNGFYFEDPVSGNEYVYVGEYHTGYALGEDKNKSEIGRSCMVYCSEDKGKTWKFKGPVFRDEDVKLEGEEGIISLAPDVSIVYSDGKYYMGFDYGTTAFTWDIKGLMHGGIAVAVSDKPEGPYSIYSKPGITNKYFYYKPYNGKFNRCYAATLLKLKNQWVILFDLDSGPYFSWGLTAITAPSPVGPWSEPVLLNTTESDGYYPSLLEYFPAFLHNDTIYAPATSVAKNRNFQCIFRVAQEDVLDPEKWQLWKEGSVWHSIHSENEYEGIWGQTFSGSVNKENRINVMFPSRDKDNRGTINLASADWIRSQRDTGFVFTGHGSPSFTSIAGFYNQPELHASFSYYGTVAVCWNYSAPLGPDHPNADAELHPLMFTAHNRLQFSDHQWLLLDASPQGLTDTIASGPLDQSPEIHLDIRYINQQINISINHQITWKGVLKNSHNGKCGLFAMNHSGIEMHSFIVNGTGRPGYTDWLYTEGLLNSGSNMKDWDVIENKDLFTYGPGAVSKTDSARAKWSFTGSGFDLYCPKMPSLGMTEIFVNGRLVGKVDLHAEKEMKSGVVFSMRNLAANKNAIVIKGKNGRIALDCLRVYE